jgi:phospholipid/cholesterol/gamma-HCH transport system permease protein
MWLRLYTATTHRRLRSILMREEMPRIEADATPDGGVVRVLGRWTAPQLARRRVLRDLQASLGAARAGAWNLTGAQLDHVGAQVLWDHWGQHWPAQVEASAVQRAVLDRVARFTVHPPPRRSATLVDLYLAFGGKVLRVGDHLKDFTRLLGMLALNIGQLIRAPHQGPWRDLTGHIYRIGATALPVTALVGSLIGVVLAYLTAVQLRQFGANAYIVNIMGLGLIRELGPMLAAILIAGRSGSAITAQIGAMRVTDELDAMSVMGISHSYRLVMPRAMALALVMPLISTWTTICGLIGGMIAADLSLGITPRYFINALPEAVEIGNLVLALSKSVVFGILIALVGCHFGLRVRPNTQSLGEGTTASVVTSITVVILVDALFAVMFKGVGF